MEINFAEFRKHLSNYVGKARYAKERIIVKQRGKIAGAFVPIEDLEAIQSLENKRDLEVFEQAMASGEFEDWDVIKKRLLEKRGLTKKFMI